MSTNTPEYAREWRRKNPGKQRAYTSRMNYGFVPPERGACQLCGKDGRLYVDHDHACCPGKRTCGGCVRGLLCNRCNIGLGFIETMGRIADEYLRRKT